MQFFDELPPSRSGRAPRIDWAAAKQKLIENEGKWGLVAENVAASTPQQIKSGRNRHFRGEDLKHFEFRVRRPESPSEEYAERRSDLYGRYSRTPIEPKPGK